MLEIGIPNFIKTTTYNSDPLKYGYFNTYKRDKYTLLVSHDGEFFSFMDIATTLRKFKIHSLFMIISKDPQKDEYTFFIGNSFYPYEKTLVNKTVVIKDENFDKQIEKTKKFILMIKTMLNTKNIIIFPIGITKEEIDELLGDNIDYKISDLTKYLLLTPTTAPANKKMIPVVAAVVLAGLFYYLGSYLGDYFQYDLKDEYNRELRVSKKQMYKQMDDFKVVKDENTRLTTMLENKNSVKIYRGER